MIKCLLNAYIDGASRHCEQLKGKQRSPTSETFGNSRTGTLLAAVRNPTIVMRRRYSCVPWFKHQSWLDAHLCHLELAHLQCCVGELLQCGGAHDAHQVLAHLVVAGQGTRTCLTTSRVMLAA